MEKYEQLKVFYPNEMGKAKGWCLKNCRIGFRVYSAKFGSACDHYCPICSRRRLLTICGEM